MPHLSRLNAPARKKRQPGGYCRADVIFSPVGERLERKVVAGRGEGRLEVTAEKHLVPVAFNVRQRAAVVVIGLLRLATI